MVTFEQLETLRTIVRYGTFRRAAEEMFLTNPAVSHRVKHLEQALGIELFLRCNSQRGLHLTEAGHRVLRFANEVIGTLGELQYDLQHRAAINRETVTIASRPLASRYVLPRLVMACRDLHPDLRVRNMQCGIEDLNEVVRRGDADFAVHTDSFVDPSLASAPLVRDRVVLVANAKHSFLREDRNEADAVKKYRFVLSPLNTETRQVAEQWASGLGVRLDVVMETSSYDALKEAAIQGVGLAILPETVVLDELADGRLHVASPAGLACDRVICLVHDPGRPLGRAAQVLLSVVREGLW